MKSFTAFIPCILLCCTAAVSAYFQVLRGDSQPSMENLTMSNTPHFMQYAALAGEKVTVNMYEGNQTILVQHNVNLVLNCSHMIKDGDEFVGIVKWTKQNYKAYADGSLRPQGSVKTYYRSTYVHKIEGEKQEILNITRTNILIGARKNDNGVYTCSVCKESGCYSASVMLFLIGAPPRMNFVDKDAPPDRVIGSYNHTDKKYRIGADFCVERGSDEVVEISCEVLGENLPKHISIPYPTPSRKWYKDDVLFYSVKKIGQSIYRGINPSFYDGQNGLLQYGIVFPQPLHATIEGEIELSFEASELTYPEYAPQGVTNLTIVDDVFNVLTGKWKCEVENMLGKWTVETVITEC